MADDYAGGTWEGRARGPVIMLGTNGPIDVPSVDDGSIDPSTMAGWGTYHALWSSDSMEYTALGSPPGIAIPSNDFGDFVHASVYPGTNFHVVRCYSAWADGEDKYTRKSPPWPFDPSTLCSDGQVAIFLPPKDGAAFLIGWDGSGHQGPESEWETREDACARCHKIRCYLLPITAGDPWVLLWEIDTRELAGDASETFDMRPHPGDGDAISNGVIMDGLFYCVVRGSSGQRLIKVQVRDVLEDPEDPESTLLVAAGELIGNTLLTSESALADGTDGVYQNTSELLCYCPQNEFHPTLQIIGPWIFGVANGKHWQLTA